MFSIESFKEKKKIIYLIVGFGIFVLIVLGLFIFQLKKTEKPESKSEREKALENVIQNLSAPEATSTPEVPKEVIENLSAPVKEKQPAVLEEVIDSLTVPKSK